MEMISPYTYRDNNKDKSLDELFLEKEELEKNWSSRRK